MATVDLGKISFVNKGTYDASTTYEERDVVQFTDGALSSYVYINATPASGQTPSTGGSVYSSHWSIFAGGVSIALGNNKLVTTNSSGTLIGTSIGSVGQAVKVTGTNTLGFGQAGGISQVIQVVKSDTGSWSASNTSPVATGLSATITPSATSSKVLIQYMINLGYGAGQAQDFLHLFRGSTEINQGDASASRKRAHNVWGGSYAGNKEDYMSHTYNGVFLDSPSTTSATTYSLKHTDAVNSGTYYINRSNRDYNAAGYDPRFVSNMILMEVTV